MNRVIVVGVFSQWIDFFLPDRRYARLGARKHECLYLRGCKTPVVVVGGEEIALYEPGLRRPTALTDVLETALRRARVSGRAQIMSCNGTVVMVGPGTQAEEARALYALHCVTAEAARLSYHECSTRLRFA